MNPITVETKAFTRELEWIARFIGKKTNIPILSNVHLRMSGGLLHFAGTDLEVGAITSIDADGPDCEFTIPVHTLLKYLKKVDDCRLSLIPDIVCDRPVEGPHVAKCPGPGSGTMGCCDKRAPANVTLCIRHGEDGAEVKLSGMPAESFPVLPERPVWCVEIGDLERAIPRVLIAISPEETRFTLNGALLNVTPKNAQFVSTDGHRLSYVDANLLAGCAIKESFQALIPKTALGEIVRLRDSVYVSRDDDHVFFTVGERTIIARALKGNFPDWKRVMPDGFKYSISAAVAPTRKLLDRISLFADERSRAVEFTVNHALTISTRMIEHSASGQIPVIGPEFAYPYVAGFDARYVTDFLKCAATDEFDLRFTKAAHAAEFGVDGWRYILMPMREIGSDPVAKGEFEPVPDVIAFLDAQPAPDAPAVQTSAPKPDAEPALADVLNAEQLGRLLRLNVATIYNHVKKGRLPAPERTGRAMTWQRSQVEDFIGARQ